MATLMDLDDRTRLSGKMDILLPPSPPPSASLTNRHHIDSLIDIELMGDDDNKDIYDLTPRPTPLTEEPSIMDMDETEIVFKVPSLPEPTRIRQTKSRHVRAKSSLQEPDMAALLARLELENQTIAKDPKSGIAAVGGHTGPGAAFEYRVRDTVCSSLSLVSIPEDALGMSRGEFWALVTRDFSAALSQLPTMTPLMIHKGVPDFLRSAVWVGVAGARDASLQAEYDSLCERLKVETPQNENIIVKDLARCFPQHDLFRDVDGQGQEMLGVVLRCYSLYDAEIGYCQGMSFLAGVLLMNMPVKDAFCVFVKLMEKHDLRTLYSTSLSGLHSRIFQLQKFLGQISPDLLNHLTKLGVELAYLSQWFMTLFATSCPFNILFRIYDVVFAEGADETIMRVALALILSNEHKILAMSELEQVLHLLLGRNLWEPYEAEPDFLMDEIARLSNVVTREELDKLRKQFDDQDTKETTIKSLGFASSFSAFRLFGHLRSPSSAKRSTSATLDMPSHTPKRSPSKRSLMTIDSSLGSGAESLLSSDSSTSTAATEFEKDVDAKKISDRGLHEQVEGLLLALSEVQREAAETAAQLKMEHRRKESMAEIVFRLKDLIITKEKELKDETSQQQRGRRKTMPSKIEIDAAGIMLEDLRRKSIVLNTVARSVSLNNLGCEESGFELQQSLGRLCCLLENNDSSLSEREKSTSPHKSDHNFDPKSPDDIPQSANSLNSDDYWLIDSNCIEKTPTLLSSPASRNPRMSSLPNNAQDDAILSELVNAKTREAAAVHERDEMKAQYDKMKRLYDSAQQREEEWSSKFHDVEQLMLSQQRTHAAELHRIRTMSTSGAPSRPLYHHNGARKQSYINTPQVRAERQGSLWPSPPPPQKEVVNTSNNGSIFGSIMPSLSDSSRPSSSSDSISTTGLVAAVKSPISSTTSAVSETVGGAWGWFTKGSSGKARSPSSGENSVTL